MYADGIELFAYINVQLCVIFCPLIVCKLRRMAKLTSKSETKMQAAAPYIAFHEGGDPYLKGSKCTNCGEVFLGAREHCAKCTSRDCMDDIELSKNGKLYNFTIVYRSYPNITVPFISAIVDLDGGGTVKGNLLDIEAVPENLEYGMPVEMVFRGAELANPAGEGFVSHFFVPSKD